MTTIMSETDWDILRKLHEGTLQWGAAVGACWPTLVSNGYVQPNFGDITPLGIKALQKKDQPNDQ
jgi:hypothetical protein